MRNLYACIVAASAIVSGCISDYALVRTLPPFAEQSNEIEIATSMNDVDPTWVLGSIVNIKTGEVRGLDNYLLPTAKPLVTPQTEVVFRDLIENSLAAEIAWLSFLQGSVNDNARAELSVIKTSKVTIAAQDVDEEKLRQETHGIHEVERADYGVIIGYVDFVLSASLYKNVEAAAGANGYGAKIGGKWYTKMENTTAQHRVVAAWSPLPFIMDLLATDVAAENNLEKATLQGIKAGTIHVRPIAKRPDYRTFLDRKKING